MKVEIIIMVIGFHGKIGSGKSLIASICKELLEESGLKVRVKSFAQPIYDVISELYEMDVDEIKTHKRKGTTLFIDSKGKEISHSELYKTSNFREILQTIGNGMRNYGHENVFVDSLFGTFTEKIIDDWMDGVKPWIIDDLRYPNEAERIRSLDCGKLFKIVREKSEDNSHQAETSLEDWEDWDYIIENNWPNLEVSKQENKRLLKEVLEI